MSSTAMEFDGRPVRVRNTFIDVDDVVQCGSTQKRNSAPASYALPPSAYEVASTEEGPESLGKLRLRLLSGCREELISEPGVSCDVDVASTAPTQALSESCQWSESGAASYHSAFHPPLQVPYMAFGGYGGFGMWAQYQTQAHHQSQDCTQAAQVGGTTLMFRNLPEYFTRVKMEKLLEAEGFGACFDFLYLPADLSSGASFGYALINMASPADAEAFMEHFHGFSRWPEPSNKQAEAHISEDLQGYCEMIERYRNSPIMHSSVPDALRPAIYCNGRRALFPQPTKALKPPRAKKANRRNAAGH